MGFHAPAVAPQLFGSSVALGAWAVVADGALALRGWVGLGLHRRGVLALAAGLAVLPVASGHVTTVELWVPCLLAAAVLGRVGLLRWPGLELASTNAAPAAPVIPASASASASASAPAPAPVPPATPLIRGSSPAAPAATATPATPAASSVTATPSGDERGQNPSAQKSRARARVLGRAAARAGTIVSRDVNIAIPRAARAAGRAAGRVRRPPDQP
jgi:hypothetical protein